MEVLEELARRRRFGMRPGLGTIRELCAALGHPEDAVPAVHIAGTNGKGATAALIDAVLRCAGLRIGRYTSPHLVNLNERFFVDGRPIDDETLCRAAAAVERIVAGGEATFFEALTALAFKLFAEAKVDYAVFECGLGGRLDATNVAKSAISVITRIGLDHCDWLGDTLEKIAGEKAGIIKHGVPVVLGANEAAVVEVVRRRAEEVGAPFHYAPFLASVAELPPTLALGGAFNRENAVTALAALKVLSPRVKVSSAAIAEGFARAVWPGRFTRVGDVIVDGAHNPPAATALARALDEVLARDEKVNLIAGFCSDKDVDGVLATLAPRVARGFAVKTVNPRSLAAAETAKRMRAALIAAESCPSLDEAIARAKADAPRRKTVICGSLFLAGEALVALGAYPWGPGRFDPAERLSCPSSPGKGVWARRFQAFRRLRRAWWSLLAFAAISVFCLAAEFVSPCDPGAIVDPAELEPYCEARTEFDYAVRSVRFSVDGAGRIYDYEGPRIELPGASSRADFLGKLPAFAQGYRTSLHEADDHLTVYLHALEPPRAIERAKVREQVEFPFRPVRGHPFGIDAGGRDVYARVVHGMRIALLFGLALTVSGMALGLVFGAIQGYFGAWADLLGQRLTEIWSALPFLYVMIFLGSVLGRGFAVLLLAYAAFNWITVSQYVRAEFLRLRSRPFVDAAKVFGFSSVRIVFRHILPNALTPLVTLFPFLLMGAIGSLSALDFLGFGLPPMTPSCGELLSEAQHFRHAWWLVAFPAAALFLVMLLAAMIGEGLREAFDPRHEARYA